MQVIRDPPRKENDMVMAGMLKEKLGKEDMPMPAMEAEGEGADVEEAAAEAPAPMDLTSVPDDAILAEAQKRGLC
jgi:hypothetical protein